VIGDSDHFLMMELRGEQTMSDQLELGWMDKDEIARDFGVWTTSDQRACGDFPLVVHRRDLPSDYPKAEKAIDDFYRDVLSRVTVPPRDYRDHQYWTEVISLHSAWVAAPRLADPEGDRFSLFRALRSAYRKVMGNVPEVGPAHPYWADLMPVVSRIQALASTSSRALSITGKVAGMVAPQLGNWLPVVDRAGYPDLLNDKALASLAKRGSYDLCVVEVIFDEFMEYARIHSRLRGLLRKGGKILVLCRMRDPRLHDRMRIKPRDFNVIRKALPACDVLELRFAGGRMLNLAQALWERRALKIGLGHTAALLGLALTALFVAPLAVIANLRASRRPPGRVPPVCTSILLEVTVV
jgi:hypothetical protein